MQFNMARLGTACAVAVVLTAGTHANGESPIFEAIRRGDARAVSTLIAQGADIQAPDDTGATPLMYAALYAGPDVLVALLDDGAPVNTGNKYGATPLMWAAGHAENVQLLVRRGADVNAKASDGVTALVAAARYSNAEAMRFSWLPARIQRRRRHEQVCSPPPISRRRPPCAMCSAATASSSSRTPM